MLNEKGLAIIIIFLIFASISATFIVPNYAFAQEEGGETDLAAPIGSYGAEGGEATLGGYIQVAYNFFVVLGVSLAILVIIFAGYKYMMSSGDPQSLEESKELLVSAIVGLILIFLTRLILGTIDERLLQFNTEPPQLNEQMWDQNDNTDDNEDEDENGNITEEHSGG